MYLKEIKLVLMAGAYPHTKCVQCIQAEFVQNTAHKLNHRPNQTHYTLKAKFTLVFFFNRLIVFHELLNVVRNTGK